MKKTTTKQPTQTIATAQNVAGVDVESSWEQKAVEEKVVLMGGAESFVEVSLGLTLTLPRRYELARVDVRVRKPCKPGREAETYTEVREFVAKRVRETWKELREAGQKEVKIKDKDA